MGKKKILVVDDEQDLCQILLFNLTASGYDAEAAFSAHEALQKDLASFHLLLLDVMMPGMSGFEFAHQLKHDDLTAHIPIIFLTAKDTENDTLKGFDLGADDYITKPFSVREVMARVKAVLNRSEIHQPGKRVLFTYEDLMVNVAEKTVSAEGKEIYLTKTEFELLWVLLENRGQVFSRQELLARVWPQDVIVTDRTVDVSITRLRKKLGKYAANIASRQGFGYYFDTQRQGDEKAE